MPAFIRPHHETLTIFSSYKCRSRANRSFDVKETTLLGVDIISTEYHSSQCNLKSSDLELYSNYPGSRFYMQGV